MNNPVNQVIQEIRLPGGQIVQLVTGDLTAESVDAIVNAANANLQHGGGVAGAISRRGGPQIQVESSDWVRRYGPVSHERPAYTSAGKLPCRYVIHAVGPVWGAGDEDRKLAAAVSGSLRVADELGLASIAFPAISTGIFGFPKARAARVTLQAIQEYFSNPPSGSLKQIRLTLVDAATIQAFQAAWDEIFPPAEQNQQDQL